MEVLAARTASTQVHGKTREAALGRLSAIRTDDIDIDVQGFHRPLTPHVPRISSQELIEGLPSLADTSSMTNLYAHVVKRLSPGTGPVCW
ncbi:MAG: hypothetical protein ACRDPY_12825 [Streptosporangiaceae bacterium]